MFFVYICHLAHLLYSIQFLIINDPSCQRKSRRSSLSKANYHQPYILCNSFYILPSCQGQADYSSPRKANQHQPYVIRIIILLQSFGFFSCKLLNDHIDYVINAITILSRSRDITFTCLLHNDIMIISPSHHQTDLNFSQKQKY